MEHATSIHIYLKMGFFCSVLIVLDNRLILLPGAKRFHMLRNCVKWWRMNLRWWSFTVSLVPPHQMIFYSQSSHTPHSHRQVNASTDIFFSPYASSPASLFLEEIGLAVFIIVVILIIIIIIITFINWYYHYYYYSYHHHYDHMSMWVFLVSIRTLKQILFLAKWDQSWEWSHYSWLHLRCM